MGEMIVIKSKIIVSTVVSMKLYIFYCSLFPFLIWGHCSSLVFPINFYSLLDVL